jgi:transcriptional regulator with XRE-family HTH domain
MDDVSSPAQTRPLRAIRVAKGLSLGEVARRTGIDCSELSKVERGLHGMSIDKLLAVARVLGLRELEEALWPYKPLTRRTGRKSSSALETRRPEKASGLTGLRGGTNYGDSTDPA